MSLIYIAKKILFNKCEYTKDDGSLSQNVLLKLYQNNVFSSTINALKRRQKVWRQEQIEKLESKNWTEWTTTI